VLNIQAEHIESTAMYDGHRGPRVQECRHCECWQHFAAMIPASSRPFFSFLSMVIFYCFIHMLRNKPSTENTHANT